MSLNYIKFTYRLIVRLFQNCKRVGRDQRISRIWNCQPLLTVYVFKTDFTTPGKSKEKAIFRETWTSHLISTGPPRHFSLFGNSTKTYLNYHVRLISRRYPTEHFTILGPQKPSIDVSQLQINWFIGVFCGSGIIRSGTPMYSIALTSWRMPSC